ncbi:MAG: YabP/YqfC family sporulation protein [Oscillospiraceae bacterium]|nr:YabP/YqfC family sporulation protein [Oscillospiraceae bacterium]
MTEKLFQRVIQKLDIPAESISGAPRVTISGGTRVLIEGHKGLLEYAEDRIAAAGSGCRVLIKGENLGLVAMDRDEMVVSGRLWAVEIE